MGNFESEKKLAQDIRDIPGDRYTQSDPVGGTPPPYGADAD